MRSARKKSRFLSKSFLLGSAVCALGAFYSLSLSSSPKTASAEQVVSKGSSSTKTITIKGNSTTESELRADPKHMRKFYEVDKQLHDLLVNIAREKYMNVFWEEFAKKEKTTVDKAMEVYVEKNVTISDKEIETIMEQIKDQPSFKNMPEKEKLSQVKNYLKTQATRALFEEILIKAEKNKDLLLPQAPTEPRYPVKLTSSDHLRYGASPEDTTPIKCKGSDCPIVIIEYSEFQCPFCKRALDSIKQVLSDKSLKGKIVWTMRHYPLPFHPDATPAAIAATCAGEQGKFWPMYYKLFQDTKNLKPATFDTYAKEISLDTAKFKACLASDEAASVVKKQMAEAQQYDVTGTPAFFINGRKLSGALPYSEFMKVITEELRLVEGKASKAKAKL